MFVVVTRCVGVAGVPAGQVRGGGGQEEPDRADAQQVCADRQEARHHRLIQLDHAGDPTTA